MHEIERSTRNGRRSTITSSPRWRGIGDVEDPALAAPRRPRCRFDRRRTPPAKQRQPQPPSNRPSSPIDWRRGDELPRVPGQWARWPVTTGCAAPTAASPSLASMGCSARDAISTCLRPRSTKSSVYLRVSSPSARTAVASWFARSVLLWFFGTAIVSVWFVFRDPRFDYRLLCLGAILPDLVDVWFGGARRVPQPHDRIAVLLVVVLASAGRKRWRKRALAIPIGMLLHLVFDGTFTNADLFWWPFSGLSFADDPLPSLDRGWLDLLLELIGLGLLTWVWHNFGLRSPARRRRFLTTGELEPVGPRGQRAV